MLWIICCVEWRQCVFTTSCEQTCSETHLPNNIQHDFIHVENDEAVSKIEKMWCRHSNYVQTLRNVSGHQYTLHIIFWLRRTSITNKIDNISLPKQYHSHTMLFGNLNTIDCCACREHIDTSQLKQCTINVPCKSFIPEHICRTRGSNVTKTMLWIMCCVLWKKRCVIIKTMYVHDIAKQTQDNNMSRNVFTPNIKYEFMNAEHTKLWQIWIHLCRH